MLRSTLAMVAALTATSAGAQNACTDDAMLVFDASGSMAAMGFNGLDLPRIVEARQALREALPSITPYRRMGLVVYGPGPRDACSNIDLRLSPQLDAAAAIISTVDRIEPDGDTPLTEAVKQASKVLSEGGRSGDVVLVTDGRETCGGSPCELAAQLVGTGITVHVIGFRVRGSSFEWQSVSDVRNHQTVARCLADETGGSYVPAESTGELVDALRDILGCASFSALQTERPTVRQ